MKTHTAIIAACLLATGGLLAQAPSPNRVSSDQDFQAMAATERAFARMAIEKGIKDAFVEYLADDSVGFYPTPTNAREFYRKLDAIPITRRLEWEPRLGDVAASGELGWLTGPFKSADVTSDKPPRYGCYFSIWKKQADGAWKVLMDVGVPTPEPVTFVAPGTARVDEIGGRFVEMRDSPLDRGNILAADERLSTSLRADTAHAYSAVLTTVSRLHLPGRQPLVGAEDILAWTRRSSSRLQTTPDGGEIARSMDVGFTRGSYEESRGADAAASQKPAETRVSEKGFYVRMWKRTADRRWTIAVEVRNPVPQER